MTTPEDVFAGPAIEMPAAPASRLVQISFRSVQDADTADATVAGADPSGPLPATPLPFGPGAVRHAAGYSPFVAYLHANDRDPHAAQTLAASPEQLLRFLRTHASAVLSDPELRRAAGIFLGNCIATMRADAAWRRDEVGPYEVSVGRHVFVPAMVLERLVDPTTTADADFDARLGGFIESLNVWVEEADDDALPPPPLPTPVPPASGTPLYVRPELPAVEIVDEAGLPIAYGSRWGAGGPPEDSYSVDAHPERFAGLHTVARALIEHLERVFDVEVVNEQARDAALLRPQRDVIERVRVLPRDPEAAPLLFAFTAYPGVIVEAGVLHWFPYPICGCEACDETAEAQAHELELLVFAVANGGYAEHYPVGRRRDLHFGLVLLDASGAVTGSSTGVADTVGLSAERLEQGTMTLAALPRGWQPWPLRRD